MSVTRFLPLLGGLVVFGLCYIAGWLVQEMTQTPVPAGIYGLLILFVGLRFLGRVPAPVRVAGNVLITHMPLFFLPAAVSLIGYRFVLLSQGMGLIVAVAVSTVIALGFTAILMQNLSTDPPTPERRHD